MCVFVRVCACVVGAGQESNDEESVSPSSNMRGTAGVSSRSRH